jgi:flagellar hook-basal body complex protein FliE
MLDPIATLGRVTGASSSIDGAMAPARGSASAVQTQPGADFGAFLTQLAGNTVGALKAGEAAALAGVTGQVSTQKVVEAVMTAEQSLQTAIAIRDKVVSAFLEVSRMQI